ncbi:hypothetical protein K4K97_14830 [Phaeobacter inhibens]|uniref:hypothetical protein n=1 Tax=Phaeobacter inhibens TaxID=221822 RepID=UPI0021A67E2E|nr:hypothetical protein [Phaeobacter inhibens]UWR52533.1 hypothetical protein K4F84_15230 [Phaeobacter inhibens]UWR68101.1 hypothetical protein K4K95_15435 [Phaeobacter inhibens]UWR79860.1 hypothetical protein K4K97_14830 [Phaeobacter inhibens]
MLTMRLQTFIKLCHFDQVELVSALDAMLNNPGGGHNFHWSLKKAIHCHIEGSTPEEIEDILGTPSKEAERKYNKAAYENFIAKFGKVKQIEVVDQERVYSVPNFDIELKVDPWFRTFEKGQSHLHLVWAIQKPELAQRIANIGSLILLDSFKGTALGNSRFCIMDLVKPKRYSDKTISDKTKLALELACRSIETCAKLV